MAVVYHSGRSRDLPLAEVTRSWEERHTEAMRPGISLRGLAAGLALLVAVPMGGMAAADTTSTETAFFTQIRWAAIVQEGNPLTSSAQDLGLVISRGFPVAPAVYCGGPACDPERPVRIEVFTQGAWQPWATGTLAQLTDSEKPLTSNRNQTMQVRSVAPAHNELPELTSLPWTLRFLPGTSVTVSGSAIIKPTPANGNTWQFRPGRGTVTVAVTPPAAGRVVELRDTMVEGYPLITGGTTDARGRVTLRSDLTKVNQVTVTVLPSPKRAGWHIDAVPAPIAPSSLPRESRSTTSLTTQTVWTGESGVMFRGTVTVGVREFVQPAPYCMGDGCVGTRPARLQIQKTVKKRLRWMTYASGTLDSLQFNIDPAPALDTRLPSVHRLRTVLPADDTLAEVISPVVTVEVLSATRVTVAPGGLLAKSPTSGAWEFTPGEGTVTITVRPAAAGRRLVVRARSEMGDPIVAQATTDARGRATLRMTAKADATYAVELLPTRRQAGWGIFVPPPLASGQSAQ